jgi:hypothetical protein
MTPERDQELPWLKLYTAMLNDDKMLLLCKADRYCFVELLMLKRNGVLDSDAPMREMRIAAQLRCTVGELLEVMQRLIDVGLIDEQWQPRAWIKRQFPGAQSGAERMRRYRERQRDVEVTAPSQPVTQSDVLDLDIETESEKRTESDSGASAHAAPQQNKQDTPRPSAGSAEGETARKRASPRGTKRMPAEWSPSPPLIQMAISECPLVDFQAELLAIRDHEFKNAHVDWDAVVRNWLRREQKQLAQRTRVNGTGGRETKFNRMQRRQDEI